MNESSITPTERIASLLAEMADRAMEAERQRDAAKEDATQWYQSYLRKSEQLEEAREELAAQREENEKLQSTIVTYIDELEKGAQRNG